MALPYLDETPYFNGVLFNFDWLLEKNAIHKETIHTGAVKNTQGLTAPLLKALNHANI